MGETGKLAVTARGDGSRWYGRISIPESAAKAAGISAGTKVVARRGKAEIVIQANDGGRIRFPDVTGKSSRMHAFEASTTTLGLREAQLSQITASLETSPGIIRIVIPAEMLASDAKQKKVKKTVVRETQSETRPTATEQRIPIRILGTGTVSTLLTEANRSGKVVRPVSLERALEMLLEYGYEVQRLGVRLFRIDGRSLSLSELSEKLASAAGSKEHDRIVIVVD
jgi:bifunctional DNA-binding transcriptional regulator/antitoxin component of YhaV-PrlF toxin-antitoxin module